MTEASVQALTESFRTMVSSNKGWYFALLDTIREWPVAEEEKDGTYYRYLIAGEALDLARISERVIEAAKDLIPEQEQLDLLLYNRPPITITPEELKEHLGEEKYKQHLNFFYGITVEEALQEITAEEVRKEEHGIRARGEDWVTNEASARIYGKTYHELVGCFRAENNYAPEDNTSLTRIKEFNYWLFKRRLSLSDPEKSASDTKKALGWLQRHAK